MVAFSRYTFNLDDIWMWLKIYEKSPILDQQFNPQIGRFWIFGLQDLNFLMQISSSPYLFFSVNALGVAIFAFIYAKILHFTNANFIFNQLFVIALCLSYGFCVVNFGICYPEKLLIIFLCVFMFASYFVIYRKSHFLLGIIALNIALYFKEPVFLVAFAVGAIFLAHSIKAKNLFLAKYALLILCSGALYALLYLILIFPNMGKHYGRFTENTDIALETMRGFANYGINDSLIVIFLSTLALRRIYGILIKKEALEVYFDAFLGGAVIYFAVFMKLAIFESYYLLPCYVLGGASAIYFTKKYFKNIFVKIALFASLALFFTSNMPSGIYTMINLKAMGVQFHQTLEKTASYINSHPKTNIYFDGIGRGREMYAEWYASYFGEYLQKLYGAKDFDLRTKEANLKDFSLDLKSAWTLKNSLAISTPQKGDLIILNNTTIYENRLEDLGQKYDLLFTSDFPTLPYFALKPMIKYLNKAIFGAKHDILGHQNIFKYPLRSYIFVVR
ncbi:hypothetical protein [Helicobacter sp. 23-1045]